MDARHDIEALLASLGLGEAVALPKALTGGLMHRVYRADTARGALVVKALNPEVAARPGALQSIEAGERVGAALSGVVPAVAALDFSGHRLHALGGRWYAVYPWIDGQAAFPPGITAAHCAAVGDALGRMHAANLAVPGLRPEIDPPPTLDWPARLSQAPAGAAWRERLAAALPRLIAWSDAAARAVERLTDPPVLSHRDLDPKNVLWQGLSLTIIDWEAAGYVHPRRELLAALLDWADDARGGLDGALSGALLEAYARHMPVDGCWDDVFDAGRLNLLEWLDYSVRRASGLVSRDAGEIELGAAQVARTLDALWGYAAKAEALKRQLRQL